MSSEETRISKLPIWEGRVRMEPLDGGLTNRNYLVRDAKRCAVVRLGSDIPHHHVFRANELAASRAAHAAGVSPAVLFAEPGILVLEYIEGVTLREEDVRTSEYLQKIIPLIQTAHTRIPDYLDGPSMNFDVFAIMRDYAKTLEREGSRHIGKLPKLREVATDLEKAAGTSTTVFGHNDLLAANFLDDGKRLWLIDWDYAGFNTPLFDLGGLTSNNGFSEDMQKKLLESYFNAPLDAARWRQFMAMKTASLLRETMWSMVSEIMSELSFDYAAYTEENIKRFEQAYDEFSQI
ncbi:MAG: choline kinase [Sneathiella sp.]|uniref:choline/ethanolamine kinase family protein n=1 Tax=Sneathiella sp. TaxID=1964365 RepID=UPI000C51493C|nr:choline/ethanolamine kinase family protein [Sneathiella sp.]MAZ02208.1 choline kinase [Sneathiella sp.]